MVPQLLSRRVATPDPRARRDDLAARGGQRRARILEDSLAGRDPGGEGLLEWWSEEVGRPEKTESKRQMAGGSRAGGGQCALRLGCHPASGPFALSWYLCFLCSTSEYATTRRADNNECRCYSCFTACETPRTSHMSSEIVRLTLPTTIALTRSSRPSSPSRPTFRHMVAHPPLSAVESCLRAMKVGMPWVSQSFLISSHRGR